jgi:putative NADH-flavin reductase
MKIALCGATGRAGSRILGELISRNHQVLALVRTAGALQPSAGVEVAVDDLADSQQTADRIKGVDALVSAYGPPPDNVEMVGGAGSLEVAPGIALSDSGKLPPEWMPIATAHAHALEILRASTVNWTCLCPAAYFDPGERTGHFRLGTNNLILDDQGQSRISMEDYAIAMVDELEHPHHTRQRFSVGY